MARDARHQQRLGVSIEKGRWLGTGFDSGQHARFCCACSKCIPHVEAANHASETSNKCGALLQVILLTRSSTSPHFTSTVMSTPLLGLNCLHVYRQTASFPGVSVCRRKLSCACVFTVPFPLLSLHLTLVPLPRKPTLITIPQCHTVTKTSNNINSPFLKLNVLVEPGEGAPRHQPPMACSSSFQLPSRSGV